MPHSAENAALRAVAAARAMTICNACRYCEGYCAVFPAIERRTVFERADLNYLANLCHNCGECYYACPYTPPHEFAVNVPKVLAEIRAQSYRDFAWPHWYGGNVVPVLAVCLLAFLWGARGAITHPAMVAIFGAAAAFVLVMLGSAFARFSKGVPFRLQALRDVMTLKYLSGERARFHHFTFYGFLLCFASTTSAAIDYYLLKLDPPYPLLSVPVILGTLGGIGLLIGPAGLYFIKRRRDPAIADKRQDAADVSFLAMLFLTSVTGLLLLALRDTPQVNILLRIHLGVVLALFLTMPYGKFVHGFYRFAALMRYAFESGGSGQSNQGRQGKPQSRHRAIAGYMNQPR